VKVSSYRRDLGTKPVLSRLTGAALLLTLVAGCEDLAGNKGDPDMTGSANVPVAAAPDISNKPTSALVGQTCTNAWRAHGHTNQEEAKAFLAQCLADQGVVGRRMNRESVFAVATKVVPVDSPLTSLVPSDVGVFCPSYAELDAGSRAVFWRTLLTAIARPESDFQTNASLWEGGKLQQFSIGLMQLSYTDRANYGCDFGNEADIADPNLNLACGAKIITRLVKKSSMIGGGSEDKPQGAALYFSTLRSSTPGRAEIIGKTSNVPVCKAN
jgi:hypothetical protein